MNKKIMDHSVGNLLGNVRAEADEEMLSQAFIETNDFRALLSTRDFNFVVGRRGTGKTAICLKLSEAYLDDNHVLLFTIKPREHECLALLSLLSDYASDYRSARAITRIAWRTNILLYALNKIMTHWKKRRHITDEFLRNYYGERERIIKAKGLDRCIEIISSCSALSDNSTSLPGVIAKQYDLEKLQGAIANALFEIDCSAVFLFDGLDEGWIPNQLSTSILGGLAHSVADFRDSKSGIHGLLFIRDNIFRALASFDSDFSRHIEGSTIRLHWEETGLLHLISTRIRQVLKLAKVENDIKAWNRFAQRELKDREGFRSCLKYTLYRPRDLLVLLNKAYLCAARSGRNEIIGEDIDLTSKQISKDRLADLLKEYETVFPGLDLFTKIFVGTNPFSQYSTLIGLLDTAIVNNSYIDTRAGDFEVLGSGKQLFHTLYSIGFIGLHDTATGATKFCHDGMPSDLADIIPAQNTVIHPCYWKALEAEEVDLPSEIFLEIYDDYEESGSFAAQEFRTRMLGQLVDALPRMPLGSDGSAEFEQWVLRAVKILFPGILTNPQLKPNDDAIQRRDIVATNMAPHGFWKRVFDDYGTRQVVFEVKNYEKLQRDDFRQCLSYGVGDYGNFIVVVHRAKTEGLSDIDRGWVKEIYDGHKKLIFVLPAIILARCIRKLRNPSRTDYSERTLNKRLDTFSRSYLALKHQKTKPKK